MSTPSPPPPQDIFFAFPHGGITFNCAPCARCCKGVGTATDREQLQQSPALQRMQVFTDPGRHASGLVSMFTFSDGCRHLGADNLCDLQRAGGPQAKPRICRLFPFSRLVDVDGLWTLLPQSSCPWTGAEVPSPFSDHQALRSDLTAPDGTTPPWAVPALHSVVTPLPVEIRRGLERELRDRVWGLDLDGGATPTIAEMYAIHARHLPEPEHACWPMPEDPSLWLDLLRSAGAPAPLSPATERTFQAALSALRVELARFAPLGAVPVLLAAYVMWLRTLSELSARDLTGEDLLVLLPRALPVLRMLALAERPIPELPPQAPLPHLDPLWGELSEEAGAPLGETLLRLLRGQEQGAVRVLRHLGAVWRT